MLFDTHQRGIELDPINQQINQPSSGVWQEIPTPRAGKQLRSRPKMVLKQIYMDSDWYQGIIDLPFCVFYLIFMKVSYVLCKFVWWIFSAEIIQWSSQVNDPVWMQCVLIPGCSSSCNERDLSSAVICWRGDTRATRHPSPQHFLPTATLRDTLNTRCRLLATTAHNLVETSSVLTTTRLLLLSCTEIAHSKCRNAEEFSRISPVWVPHS